MQSLTLLCISMMILKSIRLCRSFHLGQIQHSSVPVRRQRYPFNPEVMATQYTINDETCAPIDQAELKKLVQKHCMYLDSYLAKKPIAAHTQNAFDQVNQLVDPKKKIILDSGCGTARSTLLLGEKYSDHIVVGIDRSFVRLNKNHLKGESCIVECVSNEESQRPFQAVSDNVLLVRAELTDFWRCCISAGWNVSHHYILYPNPYPKKARLKSRFYGHPAFPLILKLGGDITIRSNWEGYLKEFAKSVQYANDYYEIHPEVINPAARYNDAAIKGPVERTDKSVAWTNFEKKYDDVGESTYELLLKQHLQSNIHNRI